MRRANALPKLSLTSASTLGASRTLSWWELAGAGRNAVPPLFRVAKKEGHDATFAAGIPLLSFLFAFSFHSGGGELPVRTSPVGPWC